MLEKYIYQPEHTNNENTQKDIEKKERAEYRKKVAKYYLKQLENTGNDPIEAFDCTLEFLEKNVKGYEPYPEVLRGILVYEEVYKPIPKPPLKPVFNVEKFVKDVLPNNTYKNTVMYLPNKALLELCKVFVDKETATELDKIIKTHRLLWG